MTPRQAAMRRTRSTAVLVTSLLLIIGLVAWIAIARGNNVSDFEGSGNGEEQVAVSYTHLTLPTKRIV